MKFYKGTITPKESAELLGLLNGWARDDVLLTLGIMRAWPADADVQEQCLRVLSCEMLGPDAHPTPAALSYCSCSEDNGVAEIIIGVGGGVELILAAMRAFPWHSGVQTLGCRALTRVVIVRENLRRFVRSGGIETLLWLGFRRHSSNNSSSGTESNSNSNSNANDNNNNNNSNNSSRSSNSGGGGGGGAVWGLAHLCTLRYVASLLIGSRSTVKLALQFVRAEGVEAILAGMRTNIDSAEYLQTALKLLGTLCTRRVEPVMVRIASAQGGLETVLAAMALHPRSRAVQENACAVLHSVLTGRPRACERLCGAGAASTLLATLMLYKGWAPTVHATLPLVEVCAAASPLFQDAVRKARGLDLMVALIGMHRDAPRTQEICFRTLAALVRASSRAQLCAARLGATACAATFMRSKPHAHGLLVSASNAVTALAWANPEVQNIACCTGCVDVIADLLARMSASANNNTANTAVAGSNSSSSGGGTANNSNSNRGGNSGGDDSSSSSNSSSNNNSDGHCKHSIQQQRAPPLRFDIAEAFAKAIVTLLSSDALYFDYYSALLEQTLREALSKFQDSFVIMASIECLNSINRSTGRAPITQQQQQTEHSMIKDKCTAIKCPLGSGCFAKGNAGYEWCPNCCFPQVLYRCLTCDDCLDQDTPSGGKKRTPKVYCRYCWEKHHAGHTGVRVFTVGSCSSPPPVAPEPVLSQEKIRS